LLTPTLALSSPYPPLAKTSEAYPDNTLPQEPNSQPTPRRPFTTSHDNLPPLSALGPGPAIYIYFQDRPATQTRCIHLADVVVSLCRGCWPLSQAARQPRSHPYLENSCHFSHPRQPHHKTQALLTPITVAPEYTSSRSLRWLSSSVSIQLSHAKNQLKRIDIANPPSWLSHAPHQCAPTMRAAPHHRCRRVSIPRRRRGITRGGNQGGNSWLSQRRNPRPDPRRCLTEAPLSPWRKAGAAGAAVGEVRAVTGAKGNGIGIIGIIGIGIGNVMKTAVVETVASPSRNTGTSRLFLFPCS
jgi:hypothetical protein